ncbi:MAG: YifB family Mg chelatase-like AAA ATPase [Planctomycetales bacterium]|nr:YifB family Mg chelatase-like AAA ATPase [Planctomycetales bacterium]
MLAKLKTYTLVGIEALPVEVEVDVSPAQMPSTVLVGLPDQAVRESTHRVARAIINSGFIRPFDRIVINLAPAEQPKQAASLDLPISLGILGASQQLDQESLSEFAVVGELSLQGDTRPAKGALSMAIRAAQDPSLRGILVPAASAAEAAVVEDINVIPIASLTQAVAFFSGQIDIPPAPSNLSQWFTRFSGYDFDYADVHGQEAAKRALTIAAAGMHNLLMLGPPGTGKTMLASRVPTIMPVLSPAESIETTRIYSAIGRLTPGQPLMATRPFRAPHHTISEAGLVGGGNPPAPGEISIAHNGVLFLDELPEFNRRTLEVLRQPLEDGTVTISRALRSTTFPAEFMLVTAMNPCPCGYRSDPRRSCSCNTLQIERYMGRISGPLLDRIDLHIEVAAVPYQDLAQSRAGLDSDQMRIEVENARTRQGERFTDSRTRCNGHMSSREIRSFCRLDDAGRKRLKNAVNELGLSARAHDKVLRVARTIADIEGKDDILAEHVDEAVNYRLLDRQKR